VWSIVGPQQHSEKGPWRCADQPVKRARSTAQTGRLPTCVVFDIEGTVAPISFVSQTLFPYARAHARAFLEAEAAQSQQPNITALRAQAAEVRCAIVSAVHTILQPLCMYTVSWHDYQSLTCHVCTLSTGASPGSSAASNTSACTG
jgi:hypothetical protein